MKPKISVIIPVKNNPMGIALLLESLEKQNLPKSQIEIIVVDNDSTDHTREVVRQFSVKLFIEKKPSSYIARNLGIKKARGEVVAFIDSDCIASKNWLKQGLRAIKQKNVSAVGGKIKFIFKKDNPNIYEYLDSVNKLNQKGYVKTGFAATANMFVKKEVFIKHDLFREDLLSGGDYEFGQRITKAGKKLVYSATAKVLHSARYSPKQIFKKTIRVAKGYKKLEQLGVLKHHNLNLFSWLPIIRVNKTKHYLKLKPLQKIKLILVANLQKYLSLVIRTL